MLVIENCNSLSDLRQKLIDGEEVRTVRQEPCDDAISREAVIDLYDRYRPSLATHVSEFGDELKALLSVTQKSGKWIEHPEIETSTPEYLMFYECSECGDKQCFCKPDIHKKRFCSNCGAKMESEDKE